MGLIWIFSITISIFFNKYLGRGVELKKANIAVLKQS